MPFRVMETPDLLKPGKQKSRVFDTREEAMLFIDETSQKQAEDHEERDGPPVSFFQVVEFNPQSVPHVYERAKKDRPNFGQPTGALRVTTSGAAAGGDSSGIDNLDGLETSTGLDEAAPDVPESGAE